MTPDLPEQLERGLAELSHRARAGPGRHATVYLARDLKHGRPVALKVLRPELGAVLGAERFLREIQLTAHSPAARLGRGGRALLLRSCPTADWIHPLAAALLALTSASRRHKSGGDDISPHARILFLKRGPDPHFPAARARALMTRPIPRPGPSWAKGGFEGGGRATFAGPLPEQETTADYMGRQTEA
jgi:hypothetical protein